MGPTRAGVHKHGTQTLRGSLDDLEVLTKGARVFHDATVQVLLKAGHERLTTVRVAESAGVSVGALYGCFPNSVPRLTRGLILGLQEVVLVYGHARRTLQGLQVALLADGKTGIELSTSRAR